MQPCPHLVYLILVERYGSFCYFLSHLHQVLLDVLHDDVAILVRQDLTDHVAARAEENKGEESMNTFILNCRIVNMLTCEHEHGKKNMQK